MLLWGTVCHHVKREASRFIPSIPGYALFHCGVWLRAILRETDALRRHSAELLELAREHRLGFWKALVTPFLLEGEEAERAVRVRG